MSELSELMRELRTLKHRKEKAEAAFNAAEAKYEEVRIAVLGYMNREKLDSQRSGKLACSVSSQQVVEVTDWDEYYKWMFRKKAIDALQRRVGQRAILDRIEAGEKVPGVKVSKVRRLRVTESK